MQYWLFKSEPDTFGIDHLIQSPKQITAWEGVRNFQANRFMQQMKMHDLGFFYHSSCKEPGIAGVVEVCSHAFPDPSALNPESPYFDARSSKEQTRFWCVNVKFVKKFSSMIYLPHLRQYSELNAMQILKKGNRLSITPVTQQEWDFIMKLGK